MTLIIDKETSKDRPDEIGLELYGDGVLVKINGTVKARFYDDGDFLIYNKETDKWIKGKWN